MLTLPIKKQWFDMILSGQKTEEYRSLTPYYDTRFRNIWGFPAYWGEKHEIRFRNGYRADSPSFVAQCTLSIKIGNPAWGAEPGVKTFALKIEKITERP